MKKKEMVDMLQGSIADWNKWRIENLDIDANLGGANLGGANLRYANLRYANLRDANLRYANLGDANLRDANLGTANLGGANLGGADLRDANLGGAHLRYANLRYANLRYANLGGANLSGADLRDANLGGALLPTGEKWESYLADVVPALLIAGGKPLGQWVERAWDCRSRENCPMAAAFESYSPNDVPALLRPRVEQFIHFFDAQLIPCPWTSAEVSR